MSLPWRSALLALLLLTACADTSGRPIATAGAEEPAPAPAAGSVRVTNHNWSLVVVYVLLDGRSMRLGQVETGQTMTLALPSAAHAAGSVELLADPFASEAAYRTGPLLIEPGALVQLVVENELALSHVRVEGP